MKHPLSITRRFVLFLSLFSFIFIFISWLALTKTKGMDRYDEFIYRLNVMNVDISRLESVLDIYTIAGNFEEHSLDVLQSGMDELDKDINDVAGPSYGWFFAGNANFSQMRDSITDGWRAVKKDILRLNRATGREEALLVHNAVDMNAISLRSDVEKLMEHAKTEKDAALKKKRNFFAASLLTAVILAVFGTWMFMKYTLLPVKRFFSRLTNAAEEGVFPSRFEDDIPGAARAATRSLNSIIEGERKSRLETGKEIEGLKAGLERTEGCIKSLNKVALAAGSSFSPYEVFKEAVSEASIRMGAFAAAVYIKEGVTLKLKVSTGFSRTFFYEGEEIPFDERVKESFAPKEPLIYKSVDEYPEGRSKAVLISEGVGSLVCAPVVRGDSIIGFLDMAFREEGKTLEQWEVFFLETITSAVAGATVRSDAFLKAFREKAFLERVIQQTPLGVAVFDRHGICVHANTLLKKYLGCSEETDFVGNYNIFEDSVLKDAGALASVKKSYEGDATQFFAEYKSGFSGGRTAPAKIRIMSRPLYDPDGGISHILLIYEDVPIGGGSHAALGRHP